MTACLLDATRTTWSRYRAVVVHMEGPARSRQVVELGEAVRAIRLAGIGPRPAELGLQQVVAHRVAEEYGAALPRPR